MFLTHTAMNLQYPSTIDLAAKIHAASYAA